MKIAHCLYTLAAMKIQTKLGKLLKARRESLGMTQSEVAEKISRNQPYIAAIEAGRKPSGVHIIQPIAAALGGEISIIWKDVDSQ